MPITRQYSSLLPLSEELTLASDKNYLFDLSYLTLLQLEGQQAINFLQGQITCDVKKINNNTLQKGAFCNLKGRILALADCLLLHETPCLILPTDLSERIQNTLNKTALLSKVKISPLTTLRIFGFLNQNPHDLQLSSTLPLYTHSNATGTLFVALLQTHEIGVITQAFIEKNQYRGSLAWHHQLLRNGQFEIYPESYGLFLPHDLGLHQSDHISFHKGCYKGQEIIARMHYRATLKYGLNILTIHQYPHQKIGELIDYSPTANPEEYLVALRQPLSLTSSSPHS